MSREAGIRLWIGAVVACALAGPAGGEVAYTVTDLGTFGGMESLPEAMNAHGQVVGLVSRPPAASWQFLWDATTGVLDLTLAVGQGKIWAHGINDRGEVVFASRPADEYESYLWSDTGPPEYAGTFHAAGLNNNSMVLGRVVLEGGEIHGVVWDRIGGLRPLGVLPGGGWAHGWDLNDLGQVAGEADTDVPMTGHPLRSFDYDDGVQHHAFLWSEAEGMLDLGTLGGDKSWARGVNDIGQVVGAAYTGNGDELHAFIWDEAGGMRDMGLLPGSTWSEAVGINNQGQAIGISRFPRPPQGFGNTYGAFIWDPDHGMRALENLLPEGRAWYNLYPQAINDQGQILAIGFFEAPPETWVTHAIVLTPVPEPTVLAFVTCGVAGLLRRMRRPCT